jgi:rubrerythrin
MAKSDNDVFEEIIAFAIDNEIEAYHFYTDLAAKAKNPEMKKVLLDFAAEEQGHRKLLEDFKKGKQVNLGGDKIIDLKIADYAVDVQLTKDMKYQDILILAMKKEKMAFMLYTDLAESSQEPEAKKLFAALAQQEAKHKLRFELEYDNVVFKED